MTATASQGLVFEKATSPMAAGEASGKGVAASRFNPRTGETTRIGELTDKRHAFELHADGDWVLLLDGTATKAHEPRRHTSPLRCQPGEDEQCHTPAWLIILWHRFRCRPSTGVDRRRGSSAVRA
jgi:hypothetical protein